MIVNTSISSDRVKKKSRYLSLMASRRISTQNILQLPHGIPEQPAKCTDSCAITKLCPLPIRDSLLGDISAERGQVVLKQSTACPVSSNALEEYIHYLQDNPNSDVDYVLVKVIESRPISNQIAEDLGVKHESPQIIYKILG
jgi:bacillithiol system protein YtxJ